MYELIKTFANYVLTKLNPTEFDHEIDYGKWWHFSQKQLERIVGQKLTPQQCEFLIQKCIPFILDELPGYEALSDAWTEDDNPDVIY